MSSTLQGVLFERRAIRRDAPNHGAWTPARRFSLMRMVGESERRHRFGYALGRAMNAQGMSGRELGRRMHLDPRKIEAWRAGKNLPNLYQTQELVAILGVKEELFRNPPEVPPEPFYPIADYLLGAGDQATGSDSPESGPEPPTPIRRGPKPPPRRPSTGR